MLCVQDDGGSGNKPVQILHCSRHLPRITQRHFALEMHLQFVLVQAEHVYSPAKPAINRLPKRRLIIAAVFKINRGLIRQAYQHLRHGRQPIQ